MAAVSKTPCPLWTMWSSMGITIAAGSVVIPPKTLEYMAKNCCLAFWVSRFVFSLSIALRNVQIKKKKKKKKNLTNRDSNSINLVNLII
jgi:Golgi nucleoside diphosphatase